MAKNTEKRKITRLAVIIYGIAAVVWIANCVAHIYYDTSEFLIILNGVCAVVWCVSFVVQLLRYRKGKKTADEE